MARKVLFALSGGLALMDYCTFLPNRELAVLEGDAEDIGFDTSDPASAQLGDAV
jgi:hypothetical protein